MLAETFSSTIDGRAEADSVPSSVPVVDIGRPSTVVEIISGRAEVESSAAAEDAASATDEVVSPASRTGVALVNVDMSTVDGVLTAVTSAVVLVSRLFVDA